MRLMNNRILNFKKINSIILILLVYSNLRYFKISYNFTGINNFNFIQLLGEITFYLLLLTSAIYLVKINKKALKNLIILVFTWVLISLIFNYQELDFFYIKKTIQIFFCFFIFIVFSEQKEKIDFILLENLLTTFIFLITSFALFYYELYFFGSIFVLIFLALIRNKILFYKFAILFFSIIFIYVHFYISPQYDYLDIESFVRKNSISWFVLFAFIANKIFRKQQNIYLDLFIILFTSLFLSKYVFLILLLIFGLIFISKIKNFILNYIFLFSCVLPILYTVIIIFFTGYYIEFINNIYNYIFDLDNLGIIFAIDENFQKTYQVSQINFQINNFFTDIYLGLTHRALLAEVFFQNIINNFIIDENYLLRVSYYSTSFAQNINSDDLDNFNRFKNSDFIRNYELYFKKCSDLTLKIGECAMHFGYFDSQNNITQNIFQINFNQKFNSSHNQFIDLITNFGILGILILLFLIFKIIKIIKTINYSYNFKILIVTILILLNFDNYLFYNYFNISYFVWILLGLSINLNYSTKR